MHRRPAGAAAIAAWLLLSCAAGFAHHSVAGNFDQSKSVDVRGRIKEFAIRNPHSMITLEVTGAEGAVSLFYVEWSDKNALLRRSVPIDAIRAGETVTVSVMPSRRLPNLGYFRTAT